MYTLDKDGKTVLQTSTTPVDVEAMINRLAEINSETSDLQSELDTLTAEKTTITSTLVSIQTAVPETAPTISAVPEVATVLAQTAQLVQPVSLTSTL